MNNSLMLPLTFLKFWYIDTPWEMLGFFGSLNSYFLQLFALPLCLRTFFDPLKNEYRQGLVGFSRAMGMFVKSGIIAIDLAIFLALIICESIFILAFMIFPFVTVLLLFF